MKWFGFPFLLGLVFSASLYAQEPVAEVPEIDWKTEVNKMDLQSVDLEELKIWARTLGLEETGSREDLVKRIADKLGITFDSSEAANKTVSIEAAESLNTFEMKEIGEDYIRITGKVNIVLNDKDKETSHRITADTLILNKARNILEAKGSVVYTLTRGTQVEVFRGDSLVFRLDDWMGVFYGGSSERDRTVSGKTLRFLFTGEEIHRSGEDVVIMENGLITSSLPKNPYYSIRASKIWILAPGEWGFQNAFLYIGRVPVFYFPIYFQPGDDMWFNPVIGLPEPTDRRGTYLQTTTYFFGKKKEEDSPLSFLQLGESDDTTPRVISGLYLVRDTDAPPVTANQNWTLKLLADLYTNLGVYTGLEGSLTTIGFLESWTFLAGLGFSRNVYPGAPWTPFFFQPEAGLWEQSVWNKSRVGTLELPFRYRLESRAQSMGWSLIWEFWSDPFLGEDFGSRSETFSPFALIGFGPKPSTVTESKKSSLLWSLSGAVNPTVQILNPWITSLSFTPIEARMDYGTRTHPDYLSPDPSREWFAPTRFTLPNFRINLAGELLNFGKATSRTRPVLLDPFREPTPAPVPDPGTTVPAAEPPKVDPLFPQLHLPGPVLGSQVSGAQTTSDNTFVLNYTWNGAWTTDGEYNQLLWIRPYDVDWSVRYARNQYNQSGKLGLTTGILGQTFRSEHSLSFSDRSRWSWFFDDRVSETDKDTLITSDYQNVSTQVTNANQVTISPLLWLFPLRLTTTAYSLGLRLYEKRYKTYDTINNSGVFDEYYPEWKQESVNLHEISATLPWTPFEDSQLLNINLQGKTSLDPRPVERTASINVSSRWETLFSSLSAGIKGNEIEWLPDLLKWTAEWSPFSWKLSNSLDYDLKKQRWSSETATLTGYGLTLRYFQTQTVPYYFDTLTKRWIAGFEGGSFTAGDTFFLPLETSLSYQLPSFIITDDQKITEWNLSTSVNANINIQQYTNSNLSFQTSLTFKIINYLDMSFSASSTNRAFYRYIPGLAESLGLGLFTLNPLEDILRGFYFWDEESRRKSTFKISRLSFSVIHTMPDWTLTFKLEGTPKLEGVPLQYIWSTNFSVLLEWKPISEIRNDLKVDDKGVWTIKTDS